MEAFLKNSDSVKERKEELGKHLLLIAINPINKSKVSTTYQINEKREEKRVSNDSRLPGMRASPVVDSASNTSVASTTASDRRPPPH
ncbi:hypothetical protein L1887_36086 [Cichorium endivia]|nr:hypothetical protein L1887_36086 [Cichorium endivia]